MVGRFVFPSQVDKRSPCLGSQGLPWLRTCVITVLSPWALESGPSFRQESSFWWVQLLLPWGLLAGPGCLGL